MKASGKMSNTNARGKEKQSKMFLKKPVPTFYLFADGKWTNRQIHS